MNSKEIFEKILSRIVNLDIMPGEKISENKMAERYNVSRTVVRSAFIKLQELDFVSISPQSGTFVTKINFQYIKSALILRIAIEKEIISRIIYDDIKRERLVEKLDELFEEQSKYIDSKKYSKQFAILDTQFHNEILNSYKGNMSNIIDKHLKHIIRWRNLTVLSGLTIEKILQEHEMIIKNLRTKNREKLMETIDNHIDKTVYATYSSNEKFSHYFK